MFPMFGQIKVDHNRQVVVSTPGLSPLWCVSTPLNPIMFANHLVPSRCILFLLSLSLITLVIYISPFGGHLPPVNWLSSAEGTVNGSVGRV